MCFTPLSNEHFNSNQYNYIKLKHCQFMYSNANDKMFIIRKKKKIYRLICQWYFVMLIVCCVTIRKFMSF